MPVNSSFLLALLYSQYEQCECHVEPQCYSDAGFPVTFTTIFLFSYSYQPLQCLFCPLKWLNNQLYIIIWLLKPALLTGDMNFLEWYNGLCKCFCNATQMLRVKAMNCNTHTASTHFQSNLHFKCTCSDKATAWLPVFLAAFPHPILRNASTFR